MYETLSVDYNSVAEFDCDFPAVPCSKEECYSISKENCEGKNTDTIAANTSSASTTKINAKINNVVRELKKEYMFCHS